MFKANARDCGYDDILGCFLKVFPVFEFVTLPSPLDSHSKDDVINNQCIRTNFMEKIGDIWKNIRPFLQPLTFKMSENLVVVQDVSSLIHVLKFIVDGVTQSPDVNFTEALMKVVQSHNEKFVDEQVQTLEQMIVSFGARYV